MKIEISDAAVEAALNALVAEGEDVRYYVESSLQSDEELVRELVAEEVIRAAILAALPLILGEPAAYKITKGRMYEDAVCIQISQAEVRLSQRKDGSEIIPLYAPAIRQPEQQESPNG